MTYSTSGQ